MNEVLIHLDTISYETKPKKQYRRINNRIVTNTTSISIVKMAHLVGEQGYAFVGQICKNKRKESDFIEQQVYALDFDEGISLENFLERSNKYRLKPAFVYATYSYREDAQKFRAVYVYDCVIDNYEVAKIMVMMLHKLFPEADKSCKDVGRLFLGGKKLLYLEEKERINILDLSISMQAYLKSIDSHNYARNIKNFAYSLGIDCEGNILHIEKKKINQDKEKIPKNEDFKFKTNIIIVLNQISSIFYIIYKSHKDIPRSMHRNFHENNEIQHQSQLSLEQICPLFHNFVTAKQDLPHGYKFLLATNLIYIKGMKKVFFEHLYEHKELWEIQWQYLKVHQYHPQNCKSAQCPYANICQCSTILDKLKRKIDKIDNEQQYISLAEGEEKLKNILYDCYIDSSSCIHLIKAQTALGKTYAYCNLVSEYSTFQGKPFMIVVPTNALQDEVEIRLRKKGVKVIKTPNLKRILDSMNLFYLKQEVEELYQKGFGRKIMEYIKSYIEEHSQELTEIQIETINQYFQHLQLLDGSCCVITTHAKFLDLPEKILNLYNIIVDEDILMSIFKKTGSITFREIRYILRKLKKTFINEHRICEIINMDDKSIVFTELGELDTLQIEELYRNKWEIESSFVDFYQSKVCYIAKKDKRLNILEDTVYYFNEKKLPNVKMIIVSVTLDKKLYRDFCKNRKIQYHEVPEILYRGKLVQYTYHSMSRFCINKFGYDKIKMSIKKLISNDTIQFITFKSYTDKEMDIYYGKTEGFDIFKGCDLAIVGTPHNVPYVYLLIGKYLGYDIIGHMSVRMVEYNGYKFSIMTYQTNDMQKLQLYFLNSELEQAVGRARLLREDCTVYLFSNFPCRQAKIIQKEYIKLPTEHTALFDEKELSTELVG